MKQLNKIQQAAFLLGGLMMVVGVGCFVFMWQQQLVCWLYLVGAVMFASVQLMQTYEGTNTTVSRLKRIQSLASLLFILAGILLADTAHQFFRPLFPTTIDYVNLVYNKWVLVLLVAAVLEVYSVHRIDHELSKKN